MSFDYTNDYGSPGDYHEAVVPSDDNDLPHRATLRGIWVGGAGNISMLDKGGDPLVWNSVPAGTFLKFRPRRIRSTGTTATNMVLVY